METNLNQTPKECPFCQMPPTFYTRGAFWRGGCTEHIPDAVMQPVELYEQAIIQWNRIVSDVEAIKGAKYEI